MSAWRGWFGTSAVNEGEMLPRLKWWTQLRSRPFGPRARRYGAVGRGEDDKRAPPDSERERRLPFVFLKKFFRPFSN